MDQWTGSGHSPDHDSFDVVHARVLRFFPELVSELGGCAESLIRLAGIDPGGLAQVTYRQMADLLERAAQALDCRDFGMRLATRQRGSDMFGPLGSVMRNSRSFGDAIDYVTSHSYAHSLASRIWQKPVLGEDAVFVGHDVLLGAMTGRGQAMEQILLDGHLAAMNITGGRTRVRRVHFRHQAISPPRIYRRYFGCDVRFGQNEDGVMFSARDLASPIVAGDGPAYQLATAYIDARFTRHQPPLHAEARGLITRRIASGRCTNVDIAADLGLHPRTMHRRLAAEGTSFQQIKDDVRRDVMLYYLQQTRLDFTAISEQLGFAEQSVMTRSCRHWFGTTPTDIRSSSEKGTAAFSH